MTFQATPRAMLFVFVFGFVIALGTGCGGRKGPTQVTREDAVVC